MASESVETPGVPLETTSPISQNILQSPRPSRRLLFRLGAIVTGTILGTAIEETLERSGIAPMVRRAFQKTQELYSAKLKFENDIHSLASEQTLVERVFNKGATVDLDEEQRKITENTGAVNMGIDIVIVGDSDCFSLGINDPKTGFDQPNCFVQIGVDTLDKTVLDELGIEKIRVLTAAIPGAPSGPGYPQETRQYGILSTAQIKNQNIQDFLRYGTQLKELVYCGTGDDLRELATTAGQLANIFSTLENAEKATDEQINKLLQLKTQMFEIAQQYGEHLKETANIVATINSYRLAHHLPGIIFHVVQPWSLRQQNHIPFKTIVNGNNIKGLESFVKRDLTSTQDTSRYYLDIPRINYGHDIAYMATVALRSQLNDTLPQIKAWHPDLQIIPFELMGINLEENFYAVDINGKKDKDGDGHPGPEGIIQIAVAWLRQHHKSLKSTGIKSPLSTLANIPSVAIK